MDSNKTVLISEMNSSESFITIKVENIDSDYDEGSNQSRENIQPESAIKPENTVIVPDEQSDNWAEAREEMEPENSAESADGLNGGVYPLDLFCENVNMSNEGSRGIQIRTFGVKRKLCTKSIETKYEALMEVEKGVKSKAQIAKELNIPPNTLSTWIKNSDKIKQAYLNGVYAPDRKRMRTGSFEEVEEAVLKWIKIAKEKNLPVSGPLILTKADEFAAMLGISDFKCSARWLDRFKTRNAIYFRKASTNPTSEDAIIFRKASKNPTSENAIIFRKASKNPTSENAIIFRKASKNPTSENAIIFRKASKSPTSDAADSITKPSNSNNNKPENVTIQPSAILSQYSHDDIYVADETGLFFRAFPNQTEQYRALDCHKGEESEDRLTVLVCANLSGTDKLPLLVIGKASRPNCFRNIRTLPTEYQANTKAWMTPEIFSRWVNKLDMKFYQEKRTVALVMNKCPVHVEIKGLKAVRLVFLPPNKTHPMTMTVIHNIKVYYRKHLLLWLARAMEKMTIFSINVLDALRLLQQAWCCVPGYICKNMVPFLRHLKLLDSDDTSHTDDPAPISDFGIPLAQISAIGIGGNLHEYLSIDNNLKTCASMTGDDINDDITRQVYGPHEYFDNLAEPIRQKPSVQSAMDACDILRDFLETLSDSGELLEGLSKINEVVTMKDFYQRLLYSQVNNSSLE